MSISRASVTEENIKALFERLQIEPVDQQVEFDLGNHSPCGNFRMTSALTPCFLVSSSGSSLGGMKNA